MTEKKCISCKKNLLNENGSVSFNCPNCKDYTIDRCEECRKKGAKYICPKCGFEGPN